MHWMQKTPTSLVSWSCQRRTSHLVRWAWVSKATHRDVNLWLLQWSFSTTKQLSSRSAFTADFPAGTSLEASHHFNLLQPSLLLSLSLPLTLFTHPDNFSQPPTLPKKKSLSSLLTISSLYMNPQFHPPTSQPPPHFNTIQSLCPPLRALFSAIKVGWWGEGGCMMAVVHSCTTFKTLTLWNNFKKDIQEQL